jgi:hypothetical protein
MEHRKIENIKELRAEIARLKAEAELQEQKINYNFKKVRESLKPENILKNLFSGFISINSAGKNMLVRLINFAVSVFLQRMAIRTENKVEEQIFEAIGSIAERFKSLFKRKKKKKNGDQEA